jgi:single-strand DNA-binding protein
MPLPTTTTTGRLVADPKLRYSPSGVAVVNLTVASNDRRRADDGTWSDGETTFLDVVAFKQLAEAIVEAGLSKGDAVFAMGKLQQSSWEKDGQKRSKLELLADVFGPDLRWTRTQTRHVERVSQTEARDPWGGPADAVPPF